MDTIRKIVFNDLIEIIGLEKKIFDDSWSSKIIQNQIKNLEAINLAVIQDSRIIAYIFSRIYIDFIEIERVGVIKSERRNKVGEKLMKELENIAYVKNKRKITLEVAENNFSAINFYKKLFYKKDGIRKKYYKFDNQNALLMSKELN